MNHNFVDPGSAITIALIFGTIIGIYGASLGIMGSMDYFYMNKSRFGILRIVAISGILFSFTLILIGMASLAVEEPSYLWYVIGLPGLLGFVMFSLLFIIILKRNKFTKYHKDFNEIPFR